MRPLLTCSNPRKTSCSRGLAAKHLTAINCPRPIWTLLAVAVVVSIAFGLIAVGWAWYDFRPLTDKECARLHQPLDVPLVDSPDEHRH
jgi:hypothetical protein